MAEHRWLPGETVVLQEVWHGRLWSARPMTVVEDRGDFVALWLPHGTPCAAPTTPPTRDASAVRSERILDLLERRDWIHTTRASEVSTLWLMEAGAHHATWWSWHADGRPWGWYVNLQEPFRRCDLGFQTMDLMLDIVVDDDGAWRMKDEDDFAGLVARELIDAATAQRVRDEAALAISRIETQASPFRDPWPQWRPDPAWKPPVLVDGWDRI